MASVVLNDKEGRTVTTGVAAETDTGLNGNNICRIVEDPDIPKGIILDELSCDATRSIGTDEESSFTIKGVAGTAFPVVRVGDYTITLSDIKLITIRNDERIPSLSLVFHTTGNNFISKSMPMDGDIVSVFMSSGTDTMKSLRNDYVITSVSTNKDDKQATISVTGVLNIPGIEVETVFGVDGTSKEVFREVARRNGLGFATDDADETCDSQLWICPNIPSTRFLEETGRHAWKDEMSFYDWWVDERYNINFINVNKMILENTRDFDITANSSGFASLFGANGGHSQEETQATVKCFTNDPNRTRGVFLVKKWHPVNESTEITHDIGVEIISRGYMHNPNIVSTPGADGVYEVSNVPAYDQNKTGDHILLRGRAKYGKDTSPEGEQAKANYSYADIYKKRVWTGVEYVMSDGDESKPVNERTGNVNKNHYRAEYHNVINLKELDKLNVVIEVDGLCLQVMRGEVVPLGLIKNGAEQLIQGQDEQTGRAERFYNGFYYVKGMEYTFKAESGTRGEYTTGSKYTTKLTLTRREWPVPVDNLDPKNKTT